MRHTTMSTQEGTTRDAVPETVPVAAGMGRRSASALVLHMCGVVDPWGAVLEACDANAEA
jgi:hypothetical protein